MLRIEYVFEYKVNKKLELYLFVRYNLLNICFFYVRPQVKKT